MEFGNFVKNKILWSEVILQNSKAVLDNHKLFYFVVFFMTYD